MSDRDYEDRRLYGNAAAQPQEDGMRAGAQGQPTPEQEERYRRDARNAATDWVKTPAGENFVWVRLVKEKVCAPPLDGAGRMIRDEAQREAAHYGMRRRSGWNRFALACSVLGLAGAAAIAVWLAFHWNYVWGGR